MKEIHDKVDWSSARTLIPPADFSFFTNPNETSLFFNDVESVVYGSVKAFFFDFSKLEILGVDSLMCLKAIFFNINRNTRIQKTFSGNYPANIDIAKRLLLSGFIGQSINRPTISYNNTYKMINGKKVRTDVLRTLCIFVQNYLNISKIDTRNLYHMLQELMGNTNEHAYDKRSKSLHEWYIFAEGGNDLVKFVFLDTGKGIPETVKKKPLEKLAKILNINDDAELIWSAFDGQILRSQTEDDHRGKGLPDIYEMCIKGYIRNLKVISNRGFCKYIDYKNRESIRIDSPLAGTLFNWELRKADIL